MPAVAARRLYWIVYGALALALGWVIVGQALAAHFREGAPRMALWWRPGDPGAHLALAEAALANDEGRAAEREAAAALRHSPHDPTAYRLLGEAAEMRGDSPRAERMYARAGRLTHRDAALASVFFEQAVRDGRWADAVEQADVLIRRAPRTESAVLFRLAVLARDPDFAAALAQTLTRGPSWRGAFFRELTGSAGHLPAAVRVVTALREAGGQARPEELSRLLVRLVQMGEPLEARRLWLAGLPPAERPDRDEIYDPSFSHPEAGGPFGWTVGEHIRSQVDLGAPPRRAGVRIEVRGVEPEYLARQTLTPPPGRYELESEGVWLSGQPLRLRWMVGCVGVAPIPFELSGKGQTVARGVFEVPQGCEAPVLILSHAGRDHDGPSVGLVQRVRMRRLD